MAWKAPTSMVVIPMSRKHTGGIVTKRATCPECGAVVRWREQRGIRRFQARIKECPDCGEVFR